MQTFTSQASELSTTISIPSAGAESIWGTKQRHLVKAKLHTPSPMHLLTGEELSAEASQRENQLSGLLPDKTSTNN